MTIDTKSDFKDLARMGVPVKRAAYSDRTAWIMAILAELAYIPFDEESEQTILSLAEELAKLTEQDKIAERLTAFQKILAGINPAPCNAKSLDELEGNGRLCRTSNIARWSHTARNGDREKAYDKKG